MKEMVFESKLLPEGHLHCPHEIAQKKNAHFKVIVTFEENEYEASENEIELSAIHDISEDFLSEEEINYYLNMRKRFVLCIDNKGYEASLIPRKIYEVIPEEQAEQDDCVRVIDESGEDYLYHKNHFVFVELPEEVVRVLVTT